MNLITWKIPYTCDTDLFNVIKEYNNVLHYTYNRCFENPKISTKELTEKQHTLNIKDFIGSHLLNSAIYDARALVARYEKPIVFGGKKLFKDRCQNKISHDDFIRKILSPLTSFYLKNVNITNAKSLQ